MKDDKKKQKSESSHVSGKALNVCGKGHSISKSWVMDSGAFHHMTPSKESFPSLCSTYTSSI